MLTRKELNTLKSFRKEKNGYSDRCQFNIKKIEKNWCLFFLNDDVDGLPWFIKKLKDLNDLRNVYQAITDQELQIKELATVYLSVGWFGIPGGKTGTKTHIVKDGKPICSSTIHADAEFQWCSNYPFEVECEHCKKLSKKF